MRITVHYDDGPEAELENICAVLDSLNVEYKVKDKNTNIHIDYKTPKEKLDESEEVEMEFDDEILLKFFKMAHEQNITLNQLIENILREQIEKEEKNNERRRNTRKV